jgi:hypothetical protein
MELFDENKTGGRRYPELFDENKPKNKGRKSRDTVPFTKLTERQWVNRIERNL